MLPNILIAAGLLAVAVVILTAFVWVVAGDEPIEVYDPVPVKLALPAGDKLTLIGTWREFITIPPTVELLPIVPAYRGRHHEDTIEMHVVEADWRPPYGFARIDAEAAAQ
jgi:hypothetical protein